MNGPLAELRATGELGEQGVALVYDTVRRVALADRIPPPHGRRAWDDEVVADVAHDFAADHLLGKRRIDSLLLRATDERSFASLLRRTVRNYFTDQFRATARGALGRRFGELLGRGTQFRLWVPGRSPSASASFWGLSHWTEPSRYEGEPTALVPAAFEIPDIRIVRWSPEAARRSPLADGVSLERFLEGVLRAAGGLLSVPQLIEVASYRFGLLEAPAVVSIDEPVLSASVQAVEPAPDERVAAQEKAAHILSQLSLRERQILQRLDDVDYRTMSAELDIPRSTLSDVAQRLKAIVRANLDPEDDAQLVLRELEAMCVAERD